MSKLRLMVKKQFFLILAFFVGLSSVAIAGGPGASTEPASVLPIAAKRGDQTDKLSKKVFTSTSGADPAEGLGEPVGPASAKSKIAVKGPQSSVAKNANSAPSGKASPKSKSSLQAKSPTKKVPTRAPAATSKASKAKQGKPAKTKSMKPHRK